MKLFHWHRFVPYKSDLHERQNFRGLPAGRVTQIYEACLCGKKRMRQMEGEWPMEELRMNLQEIMLECHPGPVFALSQAPLTGHLGRLVWVKEVKR